LPTTIALHDRACGNGGKTPTIAQGNSPESDTAPKGCCYMTAHAQYKPASAANTAKVLGDMAEKSTSQAKDNLDKMSAAAGEAANLMSGTYSTTFKGAQDFNAKVLNFAHANINAAFEHCTKLSSAKTPMEFYALVNDHARQQFEILSRQAQELTAIAQKMTAATTESIRGAAQKTG